jgi:hypothetical protein
MVRRSEQALTAPQLPFGKRMAVVAQSHEVAEIVGRLVIAVKQSIWDAVVNDQAAHLVAFDAAPATRVMVTLERAAPLAWPTITASSIPSETP